MQNQIIHVDTQRFLMICCRNRELPWLKGRDKIKFCYNIINCEIARYKCTRRIIQCTIVETSTDRVNIGFTFMSRINADY